MSAITKIHGMPVEVRSGSEDNTFLSAMRLREALECYQFAGADRTLPLIGQDVEMSVVTSPASVSETVTTGQIATIPGLAIDDSGYEIYITIDTEERWIWGTDAGNTSILGSLDLSGQYELGLLQQSIRDALSHQVVLSISGSSLIVENNPVSTYQIDRSEVDGPHLASHVLTGGSQQTIIDRGAEMTVAEDGSSYRISHPSLYGNDPVEMAAKITGNSSRTKFSSLAEFAVFACKSATAYSILSTALDFDILSICIDQVNTRLLVSPYARDHGAARIGMSFQVEKDKQFGE